MKEITEKELKRQELDLIPDLVEFKKLMAQEKANTS